MLIYVFHTKHMIDTVSFAHQELNVFLSLSDNLYIFLSAIKSHHSTQISLLDALFNNYSIACPFFKHTSNCHFARFSYMPNKTFNDHLIVVCDGSITLVVHVYSYLNECLTLLVFVYSTFGQFDSPSQRINRCMPRLYHRFTIDCSYSALTVLVYVLRLCVIVNIA